MRRWLKTVATKLRGVLGLGLIAGFFGLVGGGIWGVVTTVLELGLFSDPGYWQFLMRRVVEGALYWGRPAAFVGLGFGATLGMVGRRLTLRQLSWERSGLIGAVVGSLFIPAYVLVVGGVSALLSVPSTFFPAVGLFGMTGAALSVGLTELARRAERRELGVVEEVAALADPSHPGSATR